MGSTSKTKIIQVSNIAPQATKDQMYSLFHYIGRIEDIRLYPTVRDMSVALAARVSYIKFYDSYHTGIAQHLTNTVFIDRAIIVIPFYESEIPDETVALQKLATGTGIPGAFPPAELKLPQHIITTRHGVPPNETVITVDPVMIEQGLPPYPALPANLGSRKIEEIRRTVVAVNIHTSASAEDLVELFGTAGEVKYVRIGCKPGDSTRSALVEFSEQPAVINAFKMSGTNFNETPITVGHSLQAIEKPQAKTNEAAKKEIEEAMKKVHETQHMLSSTIDPASVLRMIEKDHSFRSRSRSM